MAWGVAGWAMAWVVSGVMAVGPQENTKVASDSNQRQTEVATFGGGCFWCVEAVFERLEGVTDVVSGYAGGRVPNPTYEQVCTGLTGHAEVCQIHFDPSQISYEELLEVFFKTHDPTTLNRQGPDVGTQYRSIILYHNDEQKEAAEAMIRRLNQSRAYPSRIVTEVRKFTRFYPAEPYHQDYFRNHPENRYCALVVQPKVEKAE
ncbi:MAG: peptide-methionine (S)-S-oxide reductase, partial [Planctomycetota bacterium]